MCLIRVGKVVQIEETKALCDFEGVLKEVNCALFPKVKVGDDVVVNSGFVSDIVKNKEELYKQVIFTDALSQQILQEINRYSKELKTEKFTILNISKSNDYLIEKYSIKEFLPANIRVVKCTYSLDDLDNVSVLETKQSLTDILKEILNLLEGHIKGV